MPRKPKGRVNQKYTRESLEGAIQAIEDRGLTYGVASKEFGVPKSTLKDYISGKSTLQKGPGRKCSIPAEIENDIVEKVLAAATCGFPVTKRQFLMKVGMAAKKLQLPTQFKNSIPGNDYWRCLVRRRPDLAIRNAEACSMNRLRGTSRATVNKYFEDLGKLLDDTDMAGTPTAIWNCDETSLQFCPNPSKVIGKKGRNELLARASNSKDSITILVCINASGAVMPPFCVVKGKTHRSVQSFATHDAPEDTVWSFQKNAWMCNALGIEWFEKVFLKHCGPARPQLLVLDSHGSHEVVELLDLARRNDIHIMALPPHTTHALQPLDKVVFGPFKRAYRRVCTEYLSESSDHTINKVSWPRLLKRTWEETMTPELLQKAFEATGIFPVSRNRIPDSAFAPSDVFTLRHARPPPDFALDAADEVDLDAAGDVSDDVDDAGDAAGDVSDDFDDAGDAAGDVSDDVGDAGDAAGNVSDDFDDAGDAAGNVSDDVDDAGDAAGDASGDVSDDVDDAGDAAGDASGDVSDDVLSFPNLHVPGKDTVLPSLPSVQPIIYAPSLSTTDQRPSQHEDDLSVEMIEEVPEEELFQLQNFANDIVTLPLTAADVAHLDGLVIKVDGAVPVVLNLSVEGNLPRENAKSVVQQLFGTPIPSQSTPSSKRQKPSTTATHRILTSNEVYGLKVAAKEEKERKEREKQLRKEKAAERKASAAVKKEKLAEKKALAAEKKEKLAERKALAAEKKEKLAERKALAAVKKEKLAEKKALAAEKKEKLAERKALAAEKREQLAEKKALAAEKKKMKEQKLKMQ